MTPVTVRVHGIFLQGIVKHTLEERVGQGTTVAALLKALDKKKVLGKNFFSAILSQGRAPRILLNGLPLHLHRGMETPLSPGDILSILSTLHEI